MQELLKNPRVRTLLREAESANRLFHDLQARIADTSEVRGAIDSLYRDIGHEVYVAWRDLIEGRVSLSEDTRSILHASPETEPFVTGGDPTEELPLLGPDAVAETTEDAPLPSTPDEGEDGWYTDEEDMPEGRLFDPGETRDRLPGDVTGPIEIPHPDWVAELGRSGAGRVVATEPDEATFDLEPVDSTHVDPAPAFERVDVAEWLLALRELLAGLGLPPDGAPDEDEGVRLDGASVALDTVALPDAVRTALAGQLAARARHLAVTRPDDPASGWVLARLRRQRRASRSAPVYGMLPDRAPETGAWSEDAHRWWTLLAQAAPPDA